MITKVSRFHYLTQDIDGFTHAKLAALACKGGAGWVQLRVKEKTYALWRKVAAEVKDVCKKFNAVFIINDSVELAFELGADGVHLGKNDMSPAKARKLLGSNFIIGCSANTMDDIKKLSVAGVDYIGIGPFRFTGTKQNLDPVLGLEGIKNIVKNLNNSIPVIAIGGIGLKDVDPLMSTGIYGLAVSSAVNLSENKTDAARKIKKTINECVSEYEPV